MAKRLDQLEAIWYSTSYEGDFTDYMLDSYDNYVYVYEKAGLDVLPFESWIDG